MKNMWYVDALDKHDICYSHQGDSAVARSVGLEYAAYIVKACNGYERMMAEKKRIAKRKRKARHAD